MEKSTTLVARVSRSHYDVAHQQQAENVEETMQQVLRAQAACAPALIVRVIFSKRY